MDIKDIKDMKLTQIASDLTKGPFDDISNDDATKVLISLIEQKLKININSPSYTGARIIMCELLGAGLQYLRENEIPENRTLSRLFEIITDKNIIGSSESVQSHFYEKNYYDDVDECVSSNISTVNDMMSFGTEAPFFSEDAHRYLLEAGKITDSLQVPDMKTYFELIGYPGFEDTILRRQEVERQKQQQTNSTGIRSWFKQFKAKW